MVYKLYFNKAVKEIKVSGKLKQPSVWRTANGTDPTGMKVWFTPANLEPIILQVLEYILYIQYRKFTQRIKLV